MVTITLDRLSQQPLLHDLHFGDLASFLEFLQENDYITQVGMIEDEQLSPGSLHQIQKNMSLDRSLFKEIFKNNC